jgi:hypothetical protein
LNNSAAIPFRGPVGRKLLKFACRPAFGGDFLAQLSARLCLAVESLSDGSWAAKVAELKDFDLKVAAIVGDAQPIADANFAGSFGWLAVGLDASEFTSARSKGASLEEARGPKKFVDAD